MVAGGWSPAVILRVCGSALPFWYELPSAPHPGKGDLGSWDVIPSLMCRLLFIAHPPRLCFLPFIFNQLRSQDLAPWVVGLPLLQHRLTPIVGWWPWLFLSSQHTWKAFSYINTCVCVCLHFNVYFIWGSVSPNKKCMDRVVLLQYYVELAPNFFPCNEVWNRWMW
jgi:hypothetical protein